MVGGLKQVKIRIITMAFNIEDHVLDHSKYTINYLQNLLNKLLHFNTSVDTAILINAGYSTQDKIDDPMENILNNIHKKVIRVREKNGVYINKKGKKTQKYRTRTITFDINVLMAYHNKHFDASKSVNPHFHFLFDGNARMGKYFTYLKSALREEAEAYNIRFNFMEEQQITGLNKGQLQAVKRLSWLMNKGEMDKIEQYFSTPNKLKEHLNWLVIHYHNTQNLSFFIKTVSIVNKRLKELDVSFDYEGLELKDNIFFYLSDEQKEKLDLLKEGRSIDIDLNNVLDREILKVSYGFNSDVMDILCDKFDIKNISKKLLNVIDSHANKINSKKKNNFRDIVINDIKNAINMAKNERELKQILVDSKSYKKISTKTKKFRDAKRKKVGFNLTTGRNGKIFVSFSELNMTWSNITATLMKNQKTNEKSEKLVSGIIDYTPLVDNVNDTFEKYEYRVKILLVFFVKEKINSASDIQKIEALAKKYDSVDRSEMYDITTFKNFDETIASYKNKIVLKTCKSVVESVSSMLDIAELRGWKLDLLTISGDDAFTKEAKLQIAERLNLPSDKRGKTRGVSKKYKK